MIARAYIRVVLIGLVLGALSLDAAAQVSKRPLVCWTDNAGRRACGNSIPPEYANKERTILNKQGQVVRTVPRQASAEQIAAREAELKLLEENRRADEKRAAYERSLMQSYTRVEDLAALRDERVAAIDTSIGLRQTAIQRDEAALAKLRARMPSAGSKKKTPAALPKQIEEFENTVAEHERSLADLHTRREATCQTFDQDMRRFQELKFGSVSFQSPCPAAPDLAAK